MIELRGGGAILLAILLLTDIFFLCQSILFYSWILLKNILGKSISVFELVGKASVFSCSHCFCC